MMFEQRRNERYEFSGGKIECSLNPFSDSDEEAFEAGVINFNETGLCVLSAKPLAAGQEITIRNFLSFSFRTVVVLWVEEYHDGVSSDESDEVLYKIGLSFT